MLMVSHPRARQEYRLVVIIPTAIIEPQRTYPWFFLLRDSVALAFPSRKLVESMRGVGVSGRVREVTPHWICLTAFKTSLGELQARMLDPDRWPNSKFSIHASGRKGNKVISRDKDLSELLEPRLKDFCRHFLYAIEPKRLLSTQN